MAVFKQVSIKQGLRRISSGLGYSKANASEFPWQDAVEWIGEALGQIGAYTQYNAKEIDIEIKNYKGKLPCDFVHLKRIVNTATNYPVGALDNYNANLLSNNVDTDEESSARLLANSDSDFDYNIVLPPAASHMMLKILSY